MTNWVRVKDLGKGSYGKVFLAKPTTRSLKYFAVKVAELQHYSSLLNEKRILKHFVGFPEIVQCFGGEMITEGDSFDSAFYSLVLEYAAGGTLADLIRKQKKLSENTVKEYLKMILRGLSCIHKLGFVHVDLKPANILAFPQIDGKMKLKIADFGLSRRCNKKRECNFKLKFRGTPMYMSPESIYGEVNTPLDIWSLGCILVEMVTGKHAWDDCIDLEQLMLKLRVNMETPKIPEELSKEGKDFLEKCFDRNPKRRWTADMLLQHPYLEQEKEAIKKDDDPTYSYLPHILYKFQSTIQI